jgi:hypothetical protein
MLGQPDFAIDSIAAANISQSISDYVLLFHLSLAPSST